MQLPKYDVPELSEMMTSLLGGGQGGNNPGASGAGGSGVQTGPKGSGSTIAGQGKGYKAIKSKR